MRLLAVLARASKKVSLDSSNTISSKLGVKFDFSSDTLATEQPFSGLILAKLLQAVLQHYPQVASLNQVANLQQNQSLPKIFIKLFYILSHLEQPQNAK